MSKIRNWLVTSAALSATLVMSAILSGQASAQSKTASVAQSGNEFALALYGQLAAAQQDENLFFSPASISTALAMAYGGAEGTTADEMRKTLRFELEGEPLHEAMGRLTRSLSAREAGYELALANALWGQKGYPFLKSFLELNRKHYDSRIEELDFKNAVENSRNTINRWVEQTTNDRIQDLLPPGSVSPATRLVLTNAIYFKGDWKLQFDPEHTRSETFHVTPANGVQVPLMHLREQRFRYTNQGDLQVLELPYVGERISMVVLLPDEALGLERFERSLTLSNLERWIESLSPRKLDDIALPRFKATTQYELTSSLQSLGMKTAFCTGWVASQSGMAG